ncbi:glutaredoxin [Pseudomonas nitritireducens]|uniref:Glutaredoxin n=1 Tax=Pseudomonas nitroreducens TaxID=46680 RepID=A0A7W7KRK6_PSENT|nr:hypothetical protein [Pseudomonas nitritireducens]MBB4866988.1 glutaredoxin [Pseudomonas nitritireducens]
MSIRQKHPQGIARLQQLARQRGGECLSERYTLVDDRYRFRCAEDHEWETTATIVRLGSWCPECARLRAVRNNLHRAGMARYQKLAEIKGGICLSQEYTGVTSQYRFRCSAGHEWEVSGVHALTGNWCPQCSKAQRLEKVVEEARRLAAGKGGLCLTQAYPGYRKPWHWLCHQGHSWSCGLQSVRQGSWCSECFHKSRLSNRKSPKRARYAVAKSK